MKTGALLSMMLLAAGARAGEALPGVPPERRSLVSLGVGLAEPVSRIRLGVPGGGAADNGDLGVQFGVQYVRFLTRRLGAGLSVDYVNRAATFSTRLYPSADAAVAGDAWVVLGLLRWTLLDRGPARPFVLVGAGGAWNKTTVDVRPSSWPDTATHETRRLVDDSAWVPAASVRVGLDLAADAAAPGVVTVEAGWTGLGSAGYAAAPRGEARGVSGAAGPLHVLTFAARYGWRF